MGVGGIGFGVILSSFFVVDFIAVEAILIDGAQRGGAERTAFFVTSVENAVAGFVVTHVLINHCLVVVAIGKTVLNHFVVALYSHVAVATGGI